MSDHVDGPRSIGEPAADVTDLFAFLSPENPARTVLAMCVFPSAGDDAIFSNIIDYSIVVSRMTVAGIGNEASFRPVDAKVRFSFRFDTLTRDPTGKVMQQGICTLPDGRKVPVRVNDEAGALTAEADCRVFAGLRSDPFYLAWIASELKRVPNLLQNDNVLCILVEFDSSRILEMSKGTLFGVIGETVPVPQPRGLIGHPVKRIDWVGRPEQTNIRLNNPAMSGIDDLRDLWNQQTPFAVSPGLRPLFLQRLRDSFLNWDQRDGTVDWTQEELEANARMFLDDFLVFDVARPITDHSHLEIEKATLRGLRYQTGGGRTLDANVIDILFTWLVNHDREFLQGGATAATKPGMTVFPYLATPNAELQTVSKTVELAAEPNEVWSVIRDFRCEWHPSIVRVTQTGAGIGQLRTVETNAGAEFVERLESLDDVARCLRYTNVAGVAASHYAGTLQVKPEEGGCVAAWRVDFRANGQPDIVVKTIVSTWLEAGLGGLKKHFGSGSFRNRPPKPDSGASPHAVSKRP